MRSGTLNVPGIVGLTKALEIASQEMEAEGSRLREWTDWMLQEFERNLDGVERNGHPKRRLPHNLNVHIPGIESRALLMELRDVVALSTGSACTTAKVEPSHVIQALGLGEQRAHSSVRFGLGRFITWDDVGEVCNSVISAVTSLRSAFAPVIG